MIPADPLRNLGPAMACPDCGHKTFRCKVIGELNCANCGWSVQPAPEPQGHMTGGLITDEDRRGLRVEGEAK